MIIYEYEELLISFQNKLEADFQFNIWFYLLLTEISR